MKKIVIIISAAVIFSACGKQNATPANRLNEMVDTANASLLLSGVFINGPHGEVMGTANIYVKDSMYSLTLKDFNSSNGPALHVYLSQEIQPEHFIDLGNLKSTNGSQVYDIPSGTDFRIFKYALIHCQEYNHLFGSSALQ